MTQSEPTRTVPEWLRRIALEWEVTPAHVASILGVEEIRIVELLSRRDGAEGATIPPGFDAAPALIRIYQHLVARHPKTEDQVKWLFTGHEDFGNTKPIDVMASSRENLFWVAYYLESLANKERAQRPD